MGVITVARQMGSEGDHIARLVAERLNYDFIDRRLVEEVADITDTSPEEVEKFDEKGEGRVRHFLKRLLVPQMSPGGYPLSSAAYFPEFGLEFPYLLERDESTVQYLDRGTYQLLITTLLQDFGQTGKAVILGRGSQKILADLPNVVHVRIIAPFELRCQRIEKSREMAAEDASDLVTQHDNWRKQYLRNNFNIDWDNPLLYDLTINTGRMDPQRAADLIGHAATQLD